MAHPAPAFTEPRSGWRVLPPNAVLTYHSYQWTEASRQDARKYQVGDVLAFHKESAGFAKGEYVAFEERRGEKIVVRDEQGRRFAFAPSEMEGFDVGLSRSLPVSIGERLLIRANLKEHKLFNGNIVEVAGVREDGTIVLKDDRTNLDRVWEANGQRRSPRARHGFCLVRPKHRDRRWPLSLLSRIDLRTIPIGP